MRLLPVELCADIVSYLDLPELAAVARTSNMFHHLATRPLYHSVDLSDSRRSADTERRIQQLFNTLRAHMGTGVTLIVECLALDCHWDKDSEDEFSIIPSFILPQLPFIYYHTTW